MAKTMVIDGITVEVTDRDAQVVQKMLDKLQETADQLAKATKTHESSVALIATKDAEIATLQTKLKDAELTPQKLDAAVAERATVIAKAKAILGDKLVTDGRNSADICRQVVDSRLGNTSKNWNDDQIKVSFDTLSADIKGQGTNGLTKAFSATPQLVVDEASKAYDEYKTRIGNAWMQKPGMAAN